MAKNPPLAQELDERGLPDLPFLVLTMILVVVGVIMLFSASYAQSLWDTRKALQPVTTRYFVRQVIFVGLGFAAMIAICFVSYQYWRFFSIPMLVVSIVLLLLVPILGEREGGAVRWINIFGINFQPSEVAKMAYVLTFATLMSQWRDKMDDPRYGVFPFVLIMGVIAVLLYLEPHLSATMIFIATGAVMMYLGGTNKKWLLILALVTVALLGLYLAFRGYSNDRIQAWLDPEGNADGKGYQILQSEYAIGSGGLTGLGFGKSRQKYLYLPEEQNDYIFAIVCEELGLVGAVVVIALFLLLVLRGYWISMHAHDRFGALAAAGLTTRIALQVFLNIGVVTNLLPPTGIALPFFSYGGTAMAMTMAEMGVILSISRDTTNHLVLERKLRHRKKSAGGRKV